MVRRFIVGPEVEGVFTLFAILFFLIGIVLFGLGVVGEYVGRIYQEVRKRPRFVIKQILEQKDDDACIDKAVQKTAPLLLQD